jgi:hypothetical protein
MKWLRFAWLLWFLCIIAPAHGQSPQRFSFAVIGDSPARSGDERIYSNVATSIDGSKVRFALHTGNLKPAASPCTDEYFLERKVLLNGSDKPLLLVPGANDWLSCEQASGGGYDPNERLARLREIFFDDDLTLGRDKFKVVRQSEMAKFRSYAENVRWQSGNVLFVGLNLPGLNNNFRLEGGRNREFEERLIANRIWLERAFHLASRARLAGIVIFASADPHFEEPLRRVVSSGRERDGYHELKLQLRALCAEFRGQVLFVHGQTHRLRNDQPLRDAKGAPIANFTRLQVLGAPNAPGWLRVTVNPRTPRLFQVTRLPAG